MCGFDHYNRILHGRAAFFEHTPPVTSTPPPVPSRWGLSLKQEEAPSFEGASFSSLVGTRAHVKGVESLILQPK